MTQVLLEQFPRGVVRQVRLQRGICCFEAWHLACRAVSPSIQRVTSSRSMCVSSFSL